MNPEPAPSFEKPLSKPAKAALVFGASIAILLFYLLALVSIFFLVALLGCELILVLGLLRFGLAGYLIPTMNHHVALIGLFLRNFYSRKGTELNISLTPGDAPGLFAALGDLSKKFEIPPPQTVSLEMTTNAWVRLKGFRSGAGTTILGIGYDLLAGMTRAEAEAVLAHEMAHAKLIQRGVRSWLFAGLGHLARLSNTLHEVVNAFQHAKRSCVVAEGMLRWAHWLTGLVARLVAAYSRQEEFAADRGAADVCGAAAIRSALMKLQEIGPAADRLPWRERIAQLQMGESFSSWLIKELTGKQKSKLVETPPEIHNKYSTHPLLRDRLAALPPAADHFQMDRESAISMLADPDAAAEKLITEVQRVIAANELKDTKQLKKWTRKTRGSTNLRPLQLVGVLCGIAGGVMLLCCVILGIYSPYIMALPLLAAALAVFFYKQGRYRDFIELPIPDYSILKQGFEKVKNLQNLDVTQKELEKELRQRADNQKNRYYKAQTLANESYAALKRCDYLRAHVAARLSLDADRKSVEGTLALAIASAALGQDQQAGWAIATVQKATGFRTSSTAWGAAWTLVLSGGWTGAEAFMEQARKNREEEPTLLLVLSHCQANRGKLQSAILSARKACTPTPRNKEHAKVLINFLLDGGYLREAEARLKLQPHLRGDVDLMFSMLRLNLLQQNLPAAEEWSRLVKETSPNPHMLVRLGNVHAAARRNEEAISFFDQALSVGFYPEACLGLARIKSQRQNKEEAKSYLLAALDTSRTLGENSIGIWPLFHQIVSELLMLQAPAPKCRAWIARLNGNATPAAIANTSFMVYAACREDAEKYFRNIINALRPGEPPLVPSIISWQEAPWQQQPDGIVRPGVQGVLG